MLVKDIMNTITRYAAIVEENFPMAKVLREMLRDPRTQVVYVKNDRDELVGMIPLSMALEYLYHEYIPPEYMKFGPGVFEGKNARARDIMLPPVYVKENDPIGKAFAEMFKYHLTELPVVDEDMHIVGDLHGLELLKKGVEEKNIF